MGLGFGVWDSGVGFRVAALGIGRIFCCRASGIRDLGVAGGRVAWELIWKMMC